MILHTPHNVVTHACIQVQMRVNTEDMCLFALRNWFPAVDDRDDLSPHNAPQSLCFGLN